MERGPGEETAVAVHQLRRAILGGRFHENDQGAELQGVYPAKFEGDVELDIFLAGASEADLFAVPLIPEELPLRAEEGLGDDRQSE